MIYVTGNKFHATLNTFTDIRKPNGAQLNSDDILIVIGNFTIEDFLVDMDEELDIIEKIIPYTIIGLSGHDGSYFGNPDKYPYEEKFGGTIKRIRNNIFQLQGGCAYLIDGKRIFVFNGGVQSNNPEFDRGVKCLKENQYSFDYVLSNHSTLSTVIYFRHNERNIDLSKQYFLDKYLVKAEFKQYIFAQGPPLCPLVKLVNEKTVYEIQ